MEKQVDRFYEFMVQYTDFMEEMANQEDKKYAALISNDLAQMDKAIAQQQAMLMKLDKLEQQRTALQQEIGWEGYSFSRILEEIPGGKRPAFQRLFDRISRLLEQIQYSNEKAQSFAKMNLHISGMLGSEEMQESLQQYMANREKTSNDGDSGTIFETKV